VSLALPPSPAPIRRRTLLVGSALTCAAGTMLMGSMLAIYLSLRDKNFHTGTDPAPWMPKGVKVPEIQTNIMLIIMFSASVMIQWAVYAVKRNDRQHAYLALGITALCGIAVLNAQVYTWIQMKMVIFSGRFATLVYSITGTFFALLIAGVVMTALLAFRTLGGRSTSAHTEYLSAAALYWHFLTFAYSAMWLVVYVTK
jgi:heme/copper-type cytochrome/quinol oxidase subunit 3